MFPGPLADSIIGKALENGKWSLVIQDIREFGEGVHKAVDDRPFGGGAGMVMRADILSQAIDKVHDEKSKIIYMSPRGKPLNHQKVKELSKEESLTIICGRYEGIDERIIEEYDVEEVSIGDYVLTGGEIPALVLIDACVRQLDSVIGNAASLDEESFSNSLLEYPQYTRPSEWRSRKVPEVLKSGNHEEINKWRKEASEQLTKERRPDLIKDIEKG